MLLALAGVAGAQVKIGVDRVGDRPRGVAGHSREEHRRPVLEVDGRQDGRVHPAGRGVGHDDRRAEREEGDRRGQGRRDHRHDDDADDAGDPRRDRRRRDADDFARVVDPHHRADGRQARVDVQDAADRRDDGRRHPRAHGEERREDDRLRRLQRRAGRGVLRRDRQGREGAQHSAGRQRALRAQGHERGRTVAEAAWPPSPTPS